MRSVFVTGDSHTQCLNYALQARAHRGEPVDPIKVQWMGTGRLMLTPFFECEGDRILLLPEEFRANIRHLERKEGQLLVFSMGMHSPVVFRHPMWKTYVPQSVWKPGSATAPLSDGFVSDIVMTFWPHVLAFYEACLDRSFEFVVMAGPPPRRIHPSMTQGIAPETVIEVDRIFRHAMTAWLGERGIPLIPEPSGVRDGDGFLSEDFGAQRELDYHHGNIAYGERLLSSLLQHPTVGLENPLGLFDSKEGLAVA